MIKLFDRWDTSTVVVQDQGLRPYINVSPIIVPHTGGRNTGVRFHKARTPIVERLINKMMGAGHKGKKHKFTSGHCGGKGLTAMTILIKTFEIIEAKTKKNPVE